MIPDIPDFGAFDSWSELLWLVVVVGIPAVAWAIRRGLASHQDVEELRLRLAKLEEQGKKAPDREELHQLALIIGQLAGRIEIVSVRSDERHQELHAALAALERKADALMTEVRTPLQLILQAHLKARGDRE